MLELEAAIERILAAIPPPQTELIPLGEAHHRILTEKIASPLDLPAFDNSAMDGYAVRSSDLREVTPETPVALRLIGRVAAGETFTGELAAGECVRVFTGSPLPAGADAVAMQEDTRLEADQPAMVWFTDSIKPWENLRFRGEDVKTGTLLVHPGRGLRAAALGLLAAVGITSVRVGKQPVVGFLATGSELVEGGEPLPLGRIYESNRAALSCAARDYGAITKIFPLVRDSLAETCAALENAFDECDMVVTSGGVSVGEMDFVKPAFEQMGRQLDFWRIAMKPGRPFVFGRREQKLLFGLPGNPASAFVTFQLLVRPALLRWQGAANINRPVYAAKLSESLANPDDRRHFMRVMYDGPGKVRLAGTQASNILVSLAAAVGLVDVPPKTTLDEGTSVWVIRM